MSGWRSVCPFLSNDRPADGQTGGNRATIATHMSEEWSPRQAAARIGTTTRTVQRWIATGRLPARRVGSRWRVASDAIVAFMTPATAPAWALRPTPATVATGP